MNPVAALIPALAQAWRLNERLDAGAYALPDVEAAYAVNDGLVETLGWQPAGQPQFWKSGGPSREATLAHAPLAPAGVRTAGAAAAPIAFADLALHEPLVEAEIALRLSCDVTAEQAAALDHAAAKALVDGLTVSAELVTSRWQQGSAAPAFLRMADCQSHGALALGHWLPFDAFTSHDWTAQRCAIELDGAAPQEATGTHSLQDPSWVLASWLRHATRGGRVVPAGSVVTTGAWLIVRGLKAGDRMDVRFDGIGAVALTL
jgi:2-keto-4-pentenoate hydratase